MGTAFHSLGLQIWQGFDKMKTKISSKEQGDEISDNFSGFHGADH